MPPRRHVVRSVAITAAALAAVACGSGGAGGSTPPAMPGTGGPLPIDATHSAAAVPAAGAGGVVRISAVGDTILGNTPNLPPDPAGYLSAVQKRLRWNAQIVFANLEGTLTNATGGKCGGSNGGTCFEFRNPPHYAHYLHHDGFTLLNDANNHSHDFGTVGLDQTIRAIHHHGMKQTGLPDQVTLVHAGTVPVAFLGFAPYSNTDDLLKLSSAAAQIREARDEASVVVVYMHAGAEGSGADHVTGHEEYYVGEDRGNAEKFAHMAIRNGASLVIASGPHVVRGMQFYRHHLIAYSLGNFANFHNFGSGGILSDSAILHVSLSSTGAFRSARLFGVLLDGSGHPTLGGGTVALVKTLSKEDFGKTRAHVASDGTISAPH
jgi:hypothetical protein